MSEGRGGNVVFDTGLSQTDVRQTEFPLREIEHGKAGQGLRGAREGHSENSGRDQAGIVVRGAPSPKPRVLSCGSASDSGPASQPSVFCFREFGGAGPRKRTRVAHIDRADITYRKTGLERVREAAEKREETQYPPGGRWVRSGKIAISHLIGFVLQNPTRRSNRPGIYGGLFPSPD
jgi:hypothetical protein